MRCSTDFAWGSTHGNLKYTAPLTSITAAVVGVILNLAVFFAYHVFWPQGFSGHFDGIGAVIGLSALLALLRYKAGVILVIAVCGALGLLFNFVKPWFEQSGVFP